MRPWRLRLGCYGHKLGNASSHQKPEEGTTDSQHLWRECGPAHTLILMEWNWFQNSGFQNWETLSVCYLGPPSLWWLVTAATGDRHSSLGSGICNNWDHLVLGGWWLQVQWAHPQIKCMTTKCCRSLPLDWWKALNIYYHWTMYFWITQGCSGGKQGRKISKASDVFCNWLSGTILHMGHSLRS